jgi:hypothetical protein
MQHVAGVLLHELIIGIKTMYKLTIAAMLCSSFLALPSHATNYKFVALDNSSETKLCIAAGSNDTKSMRKTMRHNKEHIRQVANTVECNNMAIAHFAYRYDADKTFKVLDRASSRKIRKNTPHVIIRDLSAKVRHDDKPVIIYVGNQTAN